MVYLDDLILFFKTLEEHTHHIQKFLVLLDKTVVTLKLKKSQFFI